MKHILITLVLLFTFLPSFSQWNQVSVMGSTADFYSVDYYSQNEIWIGSINRTFKTNNNGVNWSMMYPMYDTSSAMVFIYITDMVMTGTNSAYCTGLYNTGNDEVILRTTNGGSIWSTVSHNNAIQLPRQLISLDNLGSFWMAVGANGRIARSIDSGNSWSYVTSGTTEKIYDVKILSSNTVIAAAENYILKSVNGGVSWNVSSVTGGHTMVNGSGNVVYISNRNSNSMLKSINSGSTFSLLPLPFINSGAIINLGPDTVVAAGYDGIYMSVSGGQYWEKFQLSVYTQINMFDFIDSNQGIAVGTSGDAFMINNLATEPTYPVPTFTIQGGIGGTNYCLGDAISLLNATPPVPGYTYEWKLNGTTFSNQYNTSLVLASIDTQTISLTVTNANGSVTFSDQIFVIGHAMVTFSAINLSDTICNGSHAAFEIPNSQSGVTYTLRNGYSDLDVQTGTGGTIILATPLPVTSNTVYNIRATKTNLCFTDSSIYYDTVTVNTSTLTPGCTPNGIDNAMGIVNVSLNNINNNTSGAAGGYNDYSCMISTNIVVGATNSFVITASNPGYYHIWIDLDNNGGSPASEKVFTGQSSSNYISGNFVIPASFQMFNVPIRMRILYDPQSSNNSYCGQTYVGEYEDYTVTIVPAPNPPVANFIASTAVTCTTEVDFSNSTLNATSFLWDFGDGNISIIPNPTHIYTISGSYLVQLIATNNYGTDTSSQLLVIQNNITPATPVCNPIPYLFPQVEITQFELNGITVNSTANVFYEDFTCSFQTHLARNTTYNMKYYMYDIAGGCGGVTCAWIDYDGNGVFNDSTERLINGNWGGCPNPHMVIPFTVPNSAVTNTPLRIRVMVSDFTFMNSCSQIWGQYEEYTIYVDPPLPMNVGFSANITTTCLNSPVNFSNTTVNAINYLWDFGDGGSSTQMNPLHSYQSAGVYTVKLKACNSAGDCDSLVLLNYITVNSNLAQINAMGSTTFCAGDSVILAAQPVLNSYQWHRFGMPLPGATSANYTAKTQGKYHCIGLNAVCTDTSNLITVKIPCIPIGPNHEKLELNEKDEFSEMVIHPNPSTGIFHITSPPGYLQVFNSFGDVIYYGELTTTENRINLFDFPEGIYLVTLSTANSIYHMKIVLSHK